MMDKLMSETCWAQKKWNKTASDIKLVFHSSTITMMHGPINIGFSDKVCTEHQNTHFMFNRFFVRKSCRLWENVEKYGTAGQSIHDNITRRMRFACWITEATDKTPRIRNASCFSPATMVMQTHLHVTLYQRTLRVMLKAAKASFPPTINGRKPATSLKAPKETSGPKMINYIHTQF